MYTSTAKEFCGWEMLALCTILGAARGFHCRHMRLWPASEGHPRDASRSTLQGLQVQVGNEVLAGEAEVRSQVVKPIPLLLQNLRRSVHRASRSASQLRANATGPQHLQRSIPISAQASTRQLDCPSPRHHPACSRKWSDLGDGCSSSSTDVSKCRKLGLSEMNRFPVQCN